MRRRLKVYKTRVKVKTNQKYGLWLIIKRQDQVIGALIEDEVTIDVVYTEDAISELTKNFNKTN